MTPRPKHLHLAATLQSNPSELSLYAETKAIAADDERWSRCHIIGDQWRKSQPALPERRRKWGWS